MSIPTDNDKSKEQLIEELAALRRQHAASALMKSASKEGRQNQEAWGAVSPELLHAVIDAAPT